MAGINTKTTFSGHSNQGIQFASNSGHVHVNIHGQPDKLSNVTQAAFNSSERQHEPLCQHNTRVGVLNEIRAWADGQDERHIYWLNGLAGTGKSTIARTIAREYFDKDRLGASFFFSKGGGDVGHARKFFTTIASQLAKTSPSLKHCIFDAVSKNSDIEKQSLRDQWHQLILQPLSKLDGNLFPSSCILVVDALDECDGESDIRAILQLLVEARSLKTIQLRVFLTSRPEIPIRHGFYQISDAEHQDFVLHNISPSIIDNDIRIFLEYNFNLIGQVCSLDASWPGEQKIRNLIQKASGLFIWAATACRFVREGKLFAVRRLDMILEDNLDSTTAPESHLNEIYVTVLKQSVNFNFTNEEREHLHWMLRQILGSLVVLFSPFSTYSLGRLLHVTKEDVDQTLGDLHAILDIPQDRTRPLRLHHPSFRDFLINKKRCRDTNFWVDQKQAHQKLADSCIRLMTNSLKQNICSLDTYGVFVTDLDSSRMQQCLPQELQYACLYWIQHLQKSGGRLCDNDQVHQFLQVHVLHWLEALSWMQKVSEGIHAIISLESIAVTSNCSGLYEFIHDIKRFALYCQPAINEAPLQVYCSALVFAPMMSIVRTKFENRIPCWIKRLPELEKNWNAALQTLEGHSDQVNALTFSSDGKMLASASRDETVKLWDAGTGAALQTLSHLGSVNAVTFSSDGNVLAAASASEDWTVNLWDTCTGAVLQTVRGHSDWVAVAFSPDGKMLASVSDDWTVKLWDAVTGAVLQTLKGHSPLVRAVAFLSNGKVLALASRDRTIKLWDTGTGVALQTLEGHLSRVNAIAFSPDGKLLASALDDWTVELWDTGTGAALQMLEGHLSCINAIAFSPDGKVLASASADQTVKLWDTGTGVALQTFQGHSNWVNAIAFSPDGKVLASASGDRTVKLWDTGMEAALQTLEGHLDQVNAVASPDGKALASTSVDRTVKLWNAGTGTALQPLGNHSRQVTAVAFSPNGKVLASVGGLTVKLWDTGTGVVLQTLEGHLDCINAIAFSPDGKVLASASHDGMVKLWDVGTGAALQTLEGHLDWVNAVAFSSDGKVLASASDDRTVKLWDTGTGAALQTLEGHLNCINAIAFSPDGKVLASASDDRTVKLWDVGTGAALQTLEGHLDWVNAVAFSPDCKVLASSSSDQTVKLWDIDTGATLQTLEVDGVIRTISFTDDGTLLETDRGILPTTLSSPSKAPGRNLSSEIFVKERWVIRGTENMIWLPVEYRATCIAVHGSVIAIGLNSGRVSFLELAF